MKIIQHRLCRDDGTVYPFIPSPNLGGEIQHEFLVIHYTAMRDAQLAINWLIDPERKVSAHLVIGRDGNITQLVPFDKIAWHAGRSEWKGFVNLNQYSIGIELDNAGFLTRHNNPLAPHLRDCRLSIVDCRLKRQTIINHQSRWLSWLKDEYDDSEVIEAVHKHETEPRGWHTFTPEQIAAALEVSKLLVNHYNLRDVVGHDDIAPGRKLDPGPAFPMENFRARLFEGLEC
jgi:N-acetylmuramoyl-L-alanine amidase